MLSVGFVGLMLIEAGQLFGWDRPLQALLKTKGNEVEVRWRRQAEGRNPQSWMESWRKAEEVEAAAEVDKRLLSSECDK